MSWVDLLPLPIAYLLGAIPSAYIIARCNGKIDIRDEADGHISAAAVFRRVGLLPFIMVVVMDIGKAALAVLVAQWFGADPAFVMLAGVLAVAAHQWSPFLRFQGGLGATTTGGVLISTATFPTLIAAVVAIALLMKTRKSTISFAIGLLTVGIVLFVMQWSSIMTLPILIAAPSLAPPITAYHLLIAYPFILGLMQTLKAVQTRYRPGSPLKAK